MGLLYVCTRFENITTLDSADEEFFVCALIMS